MEQEKKTKQENVVAGVVGAFLGSLIGVLCTVVIGQLGYVASVSGLVMAVGALKGYELLGRKLSKKGAVISSVLVLVMTYLAHRLSWAISIAGVAEAGVFECFRAIPALLDAGALEAASYWGDLVMLYLFTLLGAVPTIIGGLRGSEMPDLPRSAAASSAGQEEDAPQAEFYPGTIPQMRPLRLSATLPGLVVLLLGLAILLVSASGGHIDAMPVVAACGCVIGGMIVVIVSLPSVRLCYQAMHVMVRAGGTVWRVDLNALNVADTYRFTKKNGAVRTLRWDRLNEEEQERAKASILRAIGLLSSGQVMPGSSLSFAVLPLTGLNVYEETKWAWKGTYSTAGGKEKKISIAKAFPGFAPAPGLEPVQGPVPARWSLWVLAAALTAVLALLGAGFGFLIDGGSAGPDRPVGTPPPVQTASQPVESTYGGVTDEEARDLFHVGSELGYRYTAVGYIKAPEGMFGHSAYVDAHVPYSDAPEYLEGGYGIRSAAHGMEVTVTIAGGYESAQEVVDAAYELFEARGTDIYQASETQYFEEYDIAVKQVVYFEEEQTKVRIVLLYADYKQDGWYLSAAIVYQPELMDEGYPALLAELSDAYALELPEIEPMSET